MRVLNTILDAIFPPRVRALRARTLSVQELHSLYAPVRIASVSPFAFSLLPYRNALVQAAITEAKFHNGTQAQIALGALLALFLSTLNPNAPCVLIPVPISKERKRERGYNQVERICSEAIKRTGTYEMDTTLLARTQHTPPQTSLGGRARRENLKGAFRTARPPDPYTLYIVIDDVITTGSTLLEAVETLKRAGARRILPIALAHSP